MAAENAGSASTPDLKCHLCRSDQTADEYLGRWLQIEQIRVHYHCLVCNDFFFSKLCIFLRLICFCALISPIMQLLATGCPQNGSFEEGLLGFMPRDIRRVIRKTESVLCTHCTGPGASIRCTVGRCKNRYHLPCGILSGCLHQYTNKFQTFCPAHLPAELMEEPTAPVKCIMCFRMIDDENPVMRIPPCCGAKSRMHRQCMLNYSYPLGYHVRCFFCQETSERYRQMLRNRGIYVSAQPDEDRCMAFICFCPRPAGPYHIDEALASHWSLTKCVTCRASCHIRCSSQHMTKCRMCI